MAINLSALQLQESGLVSHLRVRLQELILSPKQMELEMSETVVIQLTSWVVDRLKIDPSFLDSLTVDTPSQAIVQAILALASTSESRWPQPAPIITPALQSEERRMGVTS